MEKEMIISEVELNDCIKLLGCKPLLTLEEELALIQKVQDGGSDKEEALNTLLQSNMRFVIAVAKQHANKRGVAVEHLIEAGKKGVVYASERYDRTGGYKFISYAIWYINQAMKKVIKEEGFYPEVNPGSWTKNFRGSLCYTRLKRSGA